MQHPPSIRIQTSAGGVVFRKAQGQGPEVALIAVKDGRVWTLPKGLVGTGEKLDEAALREVSEETGLKGELVAKIGEVSYWYFSRDENTKFRKTVHFYLMKYLSGSTEEHDREVDESAWFPIDEAIRKVTYKGDIETLRKARQMIEKTES
jgi:8-oxo-dGTP diphosphatase